MARIRTIKPEFWTSEQVMECSPMARLLFIGLWNFCDDAGNHPLSAKTIKALIFPGDDITTAQVDAMLCELQSNDLITAYEASAKQYLHVNGWGHQKIDKPTYKHPSFVERSPSTPRAGDDRSPSGSGVLTPGKEGEGKGSNTPPPREAGAPFEMTLDWEPSENTLKAYAARAGVPVDAFTQDATAKFVMLKSASGICQTETQWVAEMVSWVQRDRASGAARVLPFRGSQSSTAPDLDGTGWAQDLGSL
ncbi:DnaT-like ssDNA-binding domain-containing protein [Pseudomonas sp. 148P]|uniref:DnaT-like ssDNA-binding domain-containing protein n=1 Tax=Pseudomonas ulcerans TaxID=3115852 RepID=A0ABU7HQ19_9PSED|nr:MULTISPECIES: DnaT-like ssDNA-binding domain-containing protein [unclassified Pseudomonas]MEE1922661.1 DnaT-like ssDNA-binding domain-containing protein [Pseudomonas sp. 147P]MEE1933638.1 DnaT-like ssDNA-binding domain-containing protein [Pseudomonas sp. 148P]